jgi:hypothetical protein
MENNSESPKRKVAENSIRQLIPHASPWKQPIQTKVIRVPAKLGDKLLEYAHILDECEDINDLKIISSKETFEVISQISKSKKSLKHGLERLRKHFCVKFEEEIVDTGEE